MQAFNGKKWEKFNSEKVASLAYARIQGKVALVTHFQNSNLMNEDKRCRPILFQSEGQSFGDKVTWLSWMPFNFLLVNFALRVAYASFMSSSVICIGCSIFHLHSNRHILFSWDSCMLDVCLGILSCQNPTKGQCF